MSRREIVKRRIYDPLQRTLHWSIGLSCLFLAATGLGATWTEAGPNRDQLWHWHIKAGHVLAMSLILRFAWGIFGPRFARWKDFFKFFILKKDTPMDFTPSSFGHDPKAALLYLVIYFAIAIMIVSGLFLAGIEHNNGPFAAIAFDRLYLKSWFEIPHYLITYFILGFTILHLGALFWHQYQQKLPMARAMFNGIQYRSKINKKENELENTNFINSDRF